MVRHALVEFLVSFFVTVLAVALAAFLVLMSVSAVGLASVLEAVLIDLGVLLFIAHKLAKHTTILNIFRKE